MFAARRLIAQGGLPLAILVAGPLSDRLFEPAMGPDGILVPLFGGLVGTGPGAGMSLVVFLAGVIGMALPFLAGYALPAVRYLEDRVPDVQVAADRSPAQPETHAPQTQKQEAR